MNNGKMFDLPPKCPGMLSTKLTGLFGWRHTYRVHHRQKGINHFNQNNLQKSYSLNLPPKKLHDVSASNPSLPEASTTVNLLHAMALKFHGITCAYHLTRISFSCVYEAKDHEKSFHNLCSFLCSN